MAGLIGDGAHLLLHSAVTVRTGVADLVVIGRDAKDKWTMEGKNPKGFIPLVFSLSSPSSSNFLLLIRNNILHSFLVDASLPMVVQDIMPAELPTECLALIVSHLWNDLTTLHRLLLCSRTLFHLVVPVLYRDPFRLIAQQHAWTDDKKTHHTAFLMRILYACARTKRGRSLAQNQPVEQDEALILSNASFHAMPVSITAESTAASSEKMPGSFADARNVLSAALQSATVAARDGGSSSNIRNTFGPSLPASVSLPLTTDYLYYYTHQGQIPKSFLAFQMLDLVVQNHHDSNVNPLPVPSRSFFFQDRAVYETAFARASLLFVLTMVAHFPSRIQVLAMTPSQLGYIVRYTQSRSPTATAVFGVESGHGNCGVEAFKMLRRLELDFGATNAPRSRWDDAAEPLTGPDAEGKDYPLLFIREHQRLFVETLSTGDSSVSVPATAASTGLWNQTVLERHEAGIESTGRASGETPILQELVVRGAHQFWSPTHLLTQIQPLQLVDLSAWNSDVPHLERIPYSRLRSLKVNIARRLDFVEIQIPYLMQCSELEEVWMPAQAPDTFRWAIDVNKSIGDFATASRQRRRYVGQSSDTTGASDATADGANHEASMTHPPEPLDQQGQSGHIPTAFESVKIPSLKRIRLYGGPLDLVPSLEDAADAFRETVEEMAGYEDGYGRRDEYSRMYISWPVLRLTSLHLRGRFVYFFDLLSLRHCPNLKVCRLQIEGNFTTTAGGTVDTPKDFSVFAGLWQLEELHLRGASWEIDNAALEKLMAGGVSGLESSSLPGSLQFFSIPEAHRPTRAGLIAFVRAMSKLRVIQLGTKYGYAHDSLREAAGSRLFVEANVNE